MNDKMNPHLILNYFRGVAKIVEEDWQRAAKSAGLTQAEQHTLWIIFFEGGASITKIAKYGLWDRSTVMQVVKRLKEKGLVYIEKDEQDLRVSYVKLTEEGKKRRAQTREVNYDFLNFIEKTKTEDPDGFDNLVNFLEKINRNYYGDDFIEWVEETDKKEIEQSKLSS